MLLPLAESFGPGIDRLTRTSDRPGKEGESRELPSRNFCRARFRVGTPGHWDCSQRSSRIGLYLTVWVLVAVFSAGGLEGLASQVANPATHVHADTLLKSLIRAHVSDSSRSSWNEICQASWNRER